MGPGLCSPGNKKREEHGRQPLMASMGPGLCSPGNIAALFCATVFQRCFNGAGAV